MVEGQKKREKLKYVCKLLEVAGWGCLLSWSGVVFLTAWGPLILTVLGLWNTSPNGNPEEGRNILTMMNYQSEFYRETGKFANSLKQLEGIKLSTENYDILIKVGDGGVHNIAIPQNKKYATFVGILWLDRSGINTSERVRPQGKICQGCGLTAPELEAIKNSEIVPGECPGVLREIIK